MNSQTKMLAAINRKILRDFNEILFTCFFLGFFFVVSDKNFLILSKIVRCLQINCWLFCYFYSTRRRLNSGAKQPIKWKKQLKIMNNFCFTLQKRKKKRCCTCKNIFKKQWLIKINLLQEISHLTKKKF